MSKAHQYEHGVSDLIQATALVDDGIVALKDGGLLAGWRYTGTSDMKAAAVVRDRLAAVLDHGKGWVLETNAIRLPSTVYPAWGEFPDLAVRNSFCDIPDFFELTEGLLTQFEDVVLHGQVASQIREPTDPRIMEVMLQVAREYLRRSKRLPAL